eukprot:TRINITY_DN31356_c0_g1_i1.p2 TRINITY_DN31356_c0_g1~~TRINITY_DN31356_c0_g1_i1.p2  ORF type:complete len:162 (-),score=27.83 TRINITY_DN31356_c0_g1_i1:15-500(-)
MTVEEKNACELKKLQSENNEILRKGQSHIDECKKSYQKKQKQAQLQFQNEYEKLNNQIRDIKKDIQFYMTKVPSKFLTELSSMDNAQTGSKMLEHIQSSRDETQKIKQQQTIQNIFHLKQFVICRQVYLSLIHISEPTRLGMISYAVFCLKKKKKQKRIQQ